MRINLRMMSFWMMRRWCVMGLVTLAFLSIPPINAAETGTVNGRLKNAPTEINPSQTLAQTLQTKAALLEALQHGTDPLVLQPQITVYKLETEVLKRLIATPNAEETEVWAHEASEEEIGTPALGSLEQVQIEQLQLMLTPLLGVEYPNLPLFEAALDAQLCQFTAKLIQSSTQQVQAPSLSLEWEKACSWRNVSHRVGPTKAQSVRTGSGIGTTVIHWQDIANSILPPDLRSWLIENSRKQQPLNFNQKISWDGQGCGCVRQELNDQVYGFFPTWWASDKPQKIDFSRLHRISVVGLTFNEDGQLSLPNPTEPQFDNFVQSARVHGTQVDWTIYRNDWKFLKQTNVRERQAVIERWLREVPLRTVDMINRPLNAGMVQAWDWLPTIGRAKHRGDGITLYLDNVPSSNERDAREQFDAFYIKLVEAFITALRKGPHTYTLNLVISDREIDTTAAFALDRLHDYLRLAEEPTQLRSGIESERVVHTSNTNVTLRFIVTLSEPTRESKKILRLKLDQSDKVRGADRRLLLRKIVPMVSPRNLGERQFADDLVYFNDNFGGVAFWPMPIQGVSTPVDFVQNFDNAFLFFPSAIEDIELKVRGWVCEHRWTMRAMFILMLLIALICWMALWFNCAWRKRWERYMPLLTLLPLFLVGGLLFSFDPAFKTWRESTYLFWILLTGVTTWAMLAMRKTHVDKP